jgi:tetratricopeptide (TPR) repeat protein
VKLAGEDSYYLAARGNYFSMIGEYSKASSDFEIALKVSPDNSRTCHFITENYIRQGKFNEAIENAISSSKRFENDTASFEQLGRIYFRQNKYLKSLGAYQKALDLMEFDKRYETIDPEMETLFLSDLHLRMAEIYKFLGDADLQCESLRKAVACLKEETRPGKVEIERDISTKMKAICN